jgi:PadR family transcriptional regulator, regulatory protein PadR
MDDKTLFQNLSIELRRGTMVLIVLQQLAQEQYGYSLLESLESKGAKLEAGSLYPLLRRLESQGLLSSQWDTSDVRPRKYYVLSETGIKMLKQLKEEWNTITNEVDTFIKENNHDQF